MPTPQELIYKSAFDLANKAGLTNRDCETAGSEAVRMWRRNMRATDAIPRAVAAAKKMAAK